MAEKRMFAKSIVFQDDFLDMPMSSRCLYYSLSMVADDDGFVDSYKSVMRQIGATADDLRILLAKRYVLAFDTGVIVIRHWRINNYLRSDRYRETKYQEEMALLNITKTGEYVLSNASCTSINAGKPNGIPSGIPMVSVEENSIEENRIDENREEKKTTPRFKPPTVEDVRDYILEKGYHIDAEAFIAFYQSKGWKVGNQQMKDWKSAVVTWEKRYEKEKKNKPTPKAHQLSEEMTHDYDMDELRRRAKL